MSAGPASPSAARARRTVAGRLLASYLVVLAAFAVTVGWSLLGLRDAARDAAVLRSAYLPLSLSIGEALAGQNVLNAQLNHITAAHNPADARQWIETAHRLRPLTFAKIRNAAVRGFEGRQDRGGLREHVLAETAAIERNLGEDDAKLEQLLHLLSQGDRSRAEVVRDELVATAAAAAKRLRGLRERVDDEMTALSAAAEARQRRSLLLLIGLSVLTLLVGLGISVYARRVLGPLSAVTERVRAVGEGDLRPRKVVATDDEIGELATAFEAMVAAIERARAELVQAERLATIGKMAAHITHEVRNPLSSISLNLELLEEEVAAGGPSADTAQLVSAIRGEVERLSRVAEQYLAAARNPRLELEPEDVGELTRECCAFVGPELERAGIRSRIEIGPDLPRAEVDEGQLRQALVNLLRNAREAMPTGGELGVSVAPTQDGGLAICVDDDGQGVPAALRDRIFEPFSTTKAGGTGLGLAVTRAIVEAHGGSIHCQPRTPRGTRFRIVLPPRAERAER